MFKYSPERSAQTLSRPRTPPHSRLRAARRACSACAQQVWRDSRSAHKTLHLHTHGKHATYHIKHHKNHLFTYPIKQFSRTWFSKVTKSQYCGLVRKNTSTEIIYIKLFAYWKTVKEKEYSYNKINSQRALRLWLPYGWSASLWNARGNAYPQWR